jgi:uncharacterized NAD(P)/FAD-binding protein YdhS
MPRLATDPTERDRVHLRLCARVRGFLTKSRARGSSALFTTGALPVGPVARGRLWEVTAVPEIRHQAASVARIIAPKVSELVDAYTI